MNLLLVNPPIYDFTAFDFWLRPYGLLRVGGRLGDKNRVGGENVSLEEIERVVRDYAKVEQVYAVGNVSWNYGDWSCTLQGENGPISVSGYRLDILIREGDVWKECMSCYNMAPTQPLPDTK